MSEQIGILFMLKHNGKSFCMWQFVSAMPRIGEQVAFRQNIFEVKIVRHGFIHPTIFIEHFGNFEGTERLDLSDWKELA